MFLLGPNKRPRACVLRIRVAISQDSDKLGLILEEDHLKHGINVISQGLCLAFSDKKFHPLLVGVRLVSARTLVLSQTEAALKKEISSMSTFALPT